MHKQFCISNSKAVQQRIRQFVDFFHHLRSLKQNKTQKRIQGTFKHLQKLKKNLYSRKLFFWKSFLYFLLLCRMHLTGQDLLSKTVRNVFLEFLKTFFDWHISHSQSLIFLSFFRPLFSLFLFHNISDVRAEALV